MPQYKVDLDRDKAQTLGIPVTDVYDALQSFLGGLYVNDFNRFGRTWRVYLQAESEYRRQPSDINRFYVRTGSGRHGAAEHAGEDNADCGSGNDLPLQPLPGGETDGDGCTGLQFGAGGGGDGGRGEATADRVRL